MSSSRDSAFAFDPPRSTADLQSALAGVRRETEALVQDMPDEEFVAAQGDHWSPAEHLRHLATALRALNRGMKIPRFVLAARFGISFEGSRSFEEVRDAYRAALASGAKASGPYDPALRPLDLEPGPARAFVMERWSQASERLESSIGSWSDAALDRYRAKHPLLGLMTARELLLFTLYHNAHHARRMRERRSR